MVNEWPQEASGIGRRCQMREGETWDRRLVSFPRRRSRSSGASTACGSSSSGPGHRPAQPADHLLLAVREVRRRPGPGRPATALRRGGPGQLRHHRAHRRHRAFRARSQPALRDVRHPAHQGRHHRRASVDRLGPRSVRTKARAVEQAFTHLEATLRRTPTETEVAAELEMSVGDFHKALRKISSVGMMALDEVLRGGERSERSTLGETLPDRSTARSTRSRPRSPRRRWSRPSTACPTGSGPC